jgi:hypothetical protein
LKQGMTDPARCRKWAGGAFLNTPFVAYRRLLGSLRQSWNCGLRGRDFSPSRRAAQAATPVANAVLSGDRAEHHVSGGRQRGPEQGRFSRRSALNNAGAQAVDHIHRNDLARNDHRNQILLYTAILVPLGIAPWLLGFAGALYGITAVAAGAIMMVLGWQVLREQRPAERASRNLFAFSILYLFLLFAVLLVERGWGGLIVRLAA